MYPTHCERAAIIYVARPFTCLRRVDIARAPPDRWATLVTPEPMQLLRLGLYPASWSTPRTAFNLNMMKDFHLLSLQANVTAQDFHTYLMRSTDNVSSAEVPVRPSPYKMKRG